MTRTLTLYRGADLDPSWDYSDWVEWPDCEFGIRCSNGEATQGELRLRDDDGQTGEDSDIPSGLSFHSLSAHNVITLTEDASGDERHIWRGWVIPKDYSRGAQKAGRYREVRVSVEDYNTELRGIIVGRDSVESRPAETDVERVLWLLGAYLDGSPRVATVIGDAYVDAGNTITMPAKEYANTSPDEVLRDCATMAGKVYWVILNDDGTLDLFYDTIDSANYNSTLQIRQTGDPTEVDGETTFEPIWDVGPASREDGQQLLSGLKLIGPGDISAYVTEALTESNYNHFEEVIYDDTVVTEAEALAKANSILTVRKKEWRTYSCSLLIPADRIHLIRPGMNITIQAKVIPDADDQVQTRRIAQMKFRVYSNQYYKVSLQLDRPIRQPFGKGSKPGPQPPSPGGAASCSLADEQMTAISSPNGDVESGGTNWTGGAQTAHGDPAPVVSDGTTAGTYMYQQIFLGGNTIEYTGWSALTFTAGVTYVCRVWFAGTATHTLTFGLVGTDDESIDPDDFFPDSNDWHAYCIAWTPSADRTGVTLRAVRDATGSTGLDNVRAFSGAPGDTPITIGGPGEGEIGTGTPVTIPIGTVIEHGDLSGKGGTLADASQIEVTPFSTIAATNVQDALEEIVSEATGGSDDQTAAEVDFTPAGTIAATDVQAAIEEVATDAAALVTAHTGDTSDAHDASAVGIADSGGYFTGTDVEAALQELGSVGGGFTNPMSAVGDLIVGGTAGAAGRLAAGSEGQHLAVASDGTLEWVDPETGGGAGATIQYPALKPATPTYDFAGASLSGDFSAHSSQGSFTTSHVKTQGIDWMGSSVELQFSSQMGAIYVAHADGDLDFQVGGITAHGLMNPGTGGAQGWMIGIAALNSSGTGIGITRYVNDGNCYLANITTWNYASFNGNAWTGAADVRNQPMWLRLKRVSGTWTAYASLSGRAWDHTFNNNPTTAVTVDRLVFGILYNTSLSLSGRVTADYFDVAV